MTLSPKKERAKNKNDIILHTLWVSSQILLHNFRQSVRAGTVLLCSDNADSSFSFGNKAAEILGQHGENEAEGADHP